MSAIDAQLDLSIVIPVYRSQDSLRLLVDRLRKVLTNLNRSWEVIFVDDNSPDNAWDVLCQLHAEDPEHIVLIQLMRNFGQHNAVVCGFHHARGRFIMTMDDDLQNPPEEIPKLLQAIESQKLDLVYGSLPKTKKHGLLRDAGSWLATRFTQYLFQSKVSGSSYRIIRREVVLSILSYDLNFTYIDGLLGWCTQRIGSVPVAHAPRTIGQSNYNMRKLLAHALNLFTNFSLLPLQLVSLLGFLFSTCGFLIGIFYLALYMLGDISVPGYTSVIVAVLIMGGVQLLALGVMGEYLGRIHLNINRKPQFVIRQTMLPTEKEKNFFSEKNSS